MNEVICRKCGYQGREFIEVITHPTSRNVYEFTYYSTPNISKTKTAKDYSSGSITWQCPSCRAILVRQQGDYGYNYEKRKPMLERLHKTSWNNKAFLKRMDKVVGR